MNSLKIYLISCHISASFWEPFCFTSSIFYIGFGVPFRMIKIIPFLCTNRIPQVDPDIWNVCYFWPPRARTKLFQNACASPARFLGILSLLVTPFSAPHSLIWSWPRLQTTDKYSLISRRCGDYAPRLQHLFTSFFASIF